MAKARAEVGSTANSYQLLARLAAVCLMAACHVGDLAQARRWLAEHPPARRAQVAATCSKLGHLVLDASPGHAP